MGGSRKGWCSQKEVRNAAVTQGNISLAIVRVAYVLKTCVKVLFELPQGCKLQGVCDGNGCGHRSGKRN